MVVAAVPVADVAGMEFYGVTPTDRSLESAPGILRVRHDRDPTVLSECLS
jgi:hypothetical protein